VGLVDFGVGGKAFFDLNAYWTEDGAVAAYNSQLQYVGYYGTNTYRGLYLSRRYLTEAQYGPRDVDVPKIIILVTDGDPNQEMQYLDGEVQTIRNAGIRIVIVGVTAGAKEANMLKMVIDKDDYTKVNNFADLELAVKKIVKMQMCIPLMPKDVCKKIVCQNGGLCTSNATSYTCTCAQGFTGRKCEQRV